HVASPAVERAPPRAGRRALDADADREGTAARARAARVVGGPHHHGGPVRREVPAGVHAQDVAGRVADPQPPFGRRLPGEPDGDLAPEAALPLASDLVAQPGLGDARAAIAAAARLPSRRGRWPVVAGLGGPGPRPAERAAADTERGRLPPPRRARAPPLGAHQAPPPAPTGGHAPANP